MSAMREKLSTQLLTGKEKLSCQLNTGKERMRASHEKLKLKVRACGDGLAVMFYLVTATLLDVRI